MILGIVAGGLQAGPPPGGGHLYWRINISRTVTGDGFFTNVLELEMRGTFGGSDLCTGGTATSSSNESGYGPANAFDGSLSAEDMWLSQNGVGGPAWLRYEFAAPVDIKQILLNGGAGGSNRWARTPRDFTVEWSDDGSAWTTQATYVNELSWYFAEGRLFDVQDPDPTWISPGAFRYFRLLITANDGGSFFGCTQLFLRDSTGTNLAFHPTTGTPSSSSDINGSNASQFAFQDTPSAGWLSAGTTSEWLKFDFGSGVTHDIRTFDIIGSWNDAGSSPQNFKLQGSNDDSSWTDLATVTGETGWAANQLRRFEVPSA